MRVLSLFDGMSCGYIAMMLEEIPIDRYVAYEIDKYAIKTSLHNFPGIEQRGDVFEADFTEFEGFDFVLAGFPCTKFSIAQKNDRETKPYSGEGWDLFEQAWRAVCEAKPKYFLFENNKSMAKAVQQEISKIVGFAPICINSALVSAQNRQRLYWVGRRNDNGTYSKVDVPIPEDRGILLKDILEDGCFVPKDKAYCLKHQAGNARDYFKKHHTDVKFEAVNVTADGKSQTIKAQYQQTSIANICCYISTYGASGVAEPVRVGCMPSPDGEIRNSQDMRVYNSEGKSVNLTAFGGGLGAKTGLYAIQVDEPPRCGYATPTEWDEDGRPIKAVSCADGKIYTVYEVKDGKITIKGKEYPIKLVDGFYIIRKLTVRECMRLQTVPEWYEFPVSDSRAYMLLGNGWTIEIIRVLIRAVKKEGRVE